MKRFHQLGAPNQRTPPESEAQVFNIREHFITQLRGFLLKKKKGFVLDKCCSSVRYIFIHQEFQCFRLNLPSSFVLALYHYLPHLSHTYTMQLVFAARVAEVTLSFNLNFLVPLASKVPYVTRQLLPHHPFFNLFTRKGIWRQVVLGKST